MSKHENKWYAILQIKKFVERICMMMQWLMQNVRSEYDNGQMQERYVHYDVMKRCLCDAWYECILRIREPEKLFPSWIQRLGSMAPNVCFLRGRHGPSVGLLKWGDQRRNPRRMHMRKAPHGDVHSTIIFTNKYKQKGIWYLCMAVWKMARSVFAPCPYLRDL